MDREDIADNLVRKCKSEPTGALEVSINLVNKIEEVYKQALDEEDETIINSELALNSTAYDGYLQACSELAKIDISKLNRNERIVFFLNVY